MMHSSNDSPKNDRLKQAKKDQQQANRYSKEDSASDILVDLARTFPSLQFFQEGGPYYHSLLEVLETYVKYRPDIGYVSLRYVFI